MYVISKTFVVYKPLGLQLLYNSHPISFIKYYTYTYNMTTKRMQIFLDYRRDETVNKKAEEWKLNKLDTVLKMIDSFEEDEDPQDAASQEFEELGIR